MVVFGSFYARFLKGIEKHFGENSCYLFSKNSLTGFTNVLAFDNTLSASAFSTVSVTPRS